ncbi:MAG: phage holin family protein [Paludibacteraceae bacterium]|nr:phage holin family protein [Paludibacteraceae bacterium]
MVFIINLLITALVVFLCAKFMSGVTVKSFGWAIVVALVLACLNALVAWLFSGLLEGVGGGVLGFVVGLLIDTGLIMLADKLMDNFKVDGFKSAIIMAAISMLVSSVLGGVL